MKIEKTALFECPSKDNILGAFRVTNPTKLTINIVDSVGQKPTTRWFHIGTIEWGPEGTMILRGLCDVEFQRGVISQCGVEKYSKFAAKYDIETKGGIIKFAD